MRSVLQDFFTGAKKKGYVEQARQMVFDFYYNRKFSKYPFQFHSAQNYELHSLKGDSSLPSKNADNFRNQPSPYYEIFKAFRQVTIDHKKVNLLDIGCGNGRVIVAGMSLGFNKITGIDIDPNGIALSKKNYALAKTIFTNTVCEIAQQDAVSYVIPNDVNVIFLSNPFGAATLQSVISNISNSYNANPRPIFIIYFNPEFPQVVEQIPGLKKIFQLLFLNGKPDLFIYKVSPLNA